MGMVGLSALTAAPLYPPLYPFLLEAESIPGPWCGQKDQVNEKFK